MNLEYQYQHGGDIYRNRVTCDFSVNINPLGMPEASVRAAQEAVLQSFSYPDDRGEELCAAIAQKENVKPDQILLGNGAAELIFTLCYALRPRTGLAPAPSFQEYTAAVAAAGGNMVFWDLKEEDGFCMKEGFLSAIQRETDIVFLCNPNNPTGTLAPRLLLEKTAEKCEETDTFFCLDECFLPFLEAEETVSMKGMLKEFPHMIILRAFTKIYGMPGLRLGYALTANTALLGRMRRCLQPWNTSLPAQMAGLAALSDTDYINRTRRLVEAEKQYLKEELSKGLAEKIYASEANYLFFQARKDLKRLLLLRGIMIRSCSNYRNLPEGFFRIGIRTHAENEELVRRWKECNH